MRVRGLKWFGAVRDDLLIESHPMRVRGLKLEGIYANNYGEGRTPCGCVD